MFSFSEVEKKILKFWQDNKIFEKTVEKTNPLAGSGRKRRDFVFYDGPPFATGLPHYGHILSSVIKDVVPRFQTMKGRYVRRRWGWDCHGLPIENLVEKELGISGKKDIEEKIGVEKFNEICRSKVLTYTKEWKKTIERIGRWVEFDNAYKTMDSAYMESVWWALKTIWDKGLIYEGKKVLMYCPRCETPVSKAEVAMDNTYKDVTEEAVTVKFKIKNPEKYNLADNTFILAWTTTPWTLPGNVALAVGKDIKYSVVKIKNEKEFYILAKDRVDIILKGKEYENSSDIKGFDLAGLEYEPLYEINDVKNSGKKAWYIALADFVNTQEGTGIVHTAVIYGEDDYNLGVKIDLPMIPLLDSKGVFNEKSPLLIKGKYFKDSEKIIKDDLKNRELLFSVETYTHSYPFCWRCETQLFYNAVSAWFINIQKIKKRLVELNKKINWYPEHLKIGRFLNILEDAPDWNISRNRYWATPLPFWKCQCGFQECIGSVKELKEKAINFNEVYNTDKVEDIDLHKHKADKIKLLCKKCKKEMNRVPEVIDCWVESASMPFAELHYPFENKDLFKKRFPGQFIAEYIAQTRTWFYYMHAIAVLLFDKISFENVVCTGTILNEKGEKLSKSKKNYTDPSAILEQYGADSLRYYLMSGVVMSAEDLFFNDREVRDSYNKIINTLWNVAEFYNMYGEKKPEGEKPKNILDRWILSKLNNLIKEVSRQMDNYDTVKTCRAVAKFIEDLSIWYVRRSRERFKHDSENKDDKNQASYVLRLALFNLSKVMAPITPFLAENIYQQIKSEKDLESVHLEDWPKVNEKLIDNGLEKKMEETRKIVALALAERAEKEIRVRQPLASLKIKNQKSKIKNDIELLKLIEDEVNIKKIVFDNSIEKEVELDLEITEELKKEGIKREVIRNVKDLRKEAGLTFKDQVFVVYSTVLVDVDEKLLKEIGAKTFKKVETESEIDVDKKNKKEMILDGKKYYIGIKVYN